MIEIIINESKQKIIRAGYGNIILPLALIFDILLLQMLTDLEFSAFVKILSLVFISYLMLKIYMSNISKIIYDSKILKLTTAFSIHEIPADKIKSIKIYPIHINMFVLISIKFGNRNFPCLYSFVSPHTSIGNYDETLVVLNKIKREIMIQAKKRGTH